VGWWAVRPAQRRSQKLDGKRLLRRPLRLGGARKVRTKGRDNKVVSRTTTSSTRLRDRKFLAEELSTVLCRSAELLFGALCDHGSEMMLALVKVI
jgi:hypothetical protein